MTYDPKNPHYDPYTAPPVFDGSQPVTGPGYPDGGYPGSPQPQQAGYPEQYSYAQPAPPVAPAYNTAGFAPPVYRQPENGTGTAALVLGILGLVACGFCAIPAVICGHMGVKKADQGLADNRSQAQAGLIMGYIGVGFLVLALLFVLLYVILGVALLGSVSSTSY